MSRAHDELRRAARLAVSGASFRWTGRDAMFGARLTSPCVETRSLEAADSVAVECNPLLEEWRHMPQRLRTGLSQTSHLSENTSVLVPSPRSERQSSVAKGSSPPSSSSSEEFVPAARPWSSSSEHSVLSDNGPKAIESFARRAVMRPLDPGPIIIKNKRPAALAAARLAEALGEDAGPSKRPKVFVAAVKPRPVVRLFAPGAHLPPRDDPKVVALEAAAQQRAAEIMGPPLTKREKQAAGARLAVREVDKDQQAIGEIL